MKHLSNRQKKSQSETETDVENKIEATFGRTCFKEMYCVIMFGWNFFSDIVEFNELTSWRNLTQNGGNELWIERSENKPKGIYEIREREREKLQRKM